MTESDSSNQGFLSNVERTISGIWDFFFLFLKTNYLIMRNPRNMQSLIARDKLVQPRTFLFIGCCIAYLSRPSFSLSLNKFNSSIIGYQQITLSSIIFGVIPVMFLILVIGNFVASFASGANLAHKEFIRMLFYYAMANSFLVFSLFSIIGRFLSGNLFGWHYDRESIEVYLIIFGGILYPMSYPSWLILSNLARLFPEQNLKDPKKYNNNISLIWFLAVSAYISSLFLFAYPLLTGTNKLFVVSPDRLPLQSQVDGQDEIIKLRLILVQHKNASIIISGKFGVVRNQGDTLGITDGNGCIFTKTSTTPNDDLTIISPNEPVIISATARRSSPGCQNMAYGGEFWVQFKGWENGDFYYYPWTKGTTEP